MGHATDKLKHQAEEAKGKIKETTGDALDDDRMKREGQSEQVGANIKQAADDVKDAASTGMDRLKGDDR